MLRGKSKPRRVCGVLGIHPLGLWVREGAQQCSLRRRSFPGFWTGRSQRARESGESPHLCSDVAGPTQGACPLAHSDGNLSFTALIPGMKQSRGGGQSLFLTLSLASQFWWPPAIPASGSIPPASASVPRDCLLPASLSSQCLPPSFKVNGHTGLGPTLTTSS